MPEIRDITMKIFVVTALCLMISVAACAGNKPKANPPQQNPTPQIMPNETKPFDAPAWLWEIPSGITPSASPMMTASSVKEPRTWQGNMLQFPYPETKQPTLSINL